MMDDHMRVSDADRERVTARLREHFADGRLTSDELDERVTAALNAKTVADLRRLMADLPEPGPVGGQPPPLWAGRATSWTGAAQRPPYACRRGPRLLPLALLLLFAALILPGPGWGLFGVLHLLVLAWIAASVVGILAAARWRRRARRQWRAGYRGPWGHGDY